MLCMLRHTLQALIPFSNTGIRCASLCILNFLDILVTDFWLYHNPFKTRISKNILLNLTFDYPKLSMLELVHIARFLVQVYAVCGVQWLIWFYQLLSASCEIESHPDSASIHASIVHKSHLIYAYDYVAPQSGYF
eukprot:NODE_12_length_45166_cov_0.552511.p20 type:complete len:135 gc:universal NODE_12_length_45166_cov_0.552511:15600-15196(-)